MITGEPLAAHQHVAVRHQGAPNRPCLLIGAESADWADVARRVGWCATLVDQPDDAASLIARHRYLLIVMNLTGRDRAQWQRIIDCVVARGHDRFAVFGDPSDSTAELAIRQLGVWFFGSGAPTSEGIEQLCQLADEASATVGA